MLDCLFASALRRENRGANERLVKLERTRDREGIDELEQCANTHPSQPTRSPGSRKIPRIQVMAWSAPPTSERRALQSKVLGAEWAVDVLLCTSAVGVTRPLTFNL